MNNHRSHTHRFHEDDVQQQMGKRNLILHHTSTEFDDGHFIAECSNPAQSLNEDIRFFDRLLHRHSLDPRPRKPRKQRNPSSGKGTWGIFEPSR